MPEQDDHSAEGFSATRQDERLDNNPYADGPRVRLGQSSGEGDFRDEAPQPRRAGALTAILGHDPATRKLMGFALALVVILLVIAGVWSLFGHRQQGIPVIGPPSYAVKERPTDPGGMQVMSDDTTHGDVTGKGAVHLAAPPEQPDARLLAGREEGTEHSTEASAKNTSPSPSPAPTVPSDTHGAGASMAPSGASDEVSPSQQSPLPAPSVPDQSPKASTPPVSSVERPVQSHPVPDTSAAPSRQERTTEGRYQVQLGALDSQAQAEREWASFRAKAADIVRGYTPRYQPVSRNGKNFVRLRIAGFSDFKSARLFCARLHAQSLACAPVAF